MPEVLADRLKLALSSRYAIERHAAYDVHPDGQRFIFITGDDDDSGELMLVQNVIAATTRSRPTAPSR